MNKDEIREMKWAKDWLTYIYYDMRLNQGLEEFDKDVIRLNKSLTWARKYYAERIENKK